MCWYNFVSPNSFTNKKLNNIIQKNNLYTNSYKNTPKTQKTQKTQKTVWI